MKQKRNEYNKNYRHSKTGLIRRSYAQMKRRINGHSRTPEIYRGLSLMPIQDFLNFCSSSLELEHLYQDWIKVDFDTRFTPSVDRIDSSKGYDVGNIRWVTHAENSRLATQKRYGT